MEIFTGNCGWCKRVAELATEGFPNPGFCITCISKVGVQHLTEITTLRIRVEELTCQKNALQVVNAESDAQLCRAREIWRDKYRAPESEMNDLVQDIIDQREMDDALSSSGPCSHEASICKARTRLGHLYHICNLSPKEITEADNDIFGTTHCLHEAKLCSVKEAFDKFISTSNTPVSRPAWTLVNEVAAILLSVAPCVHAAKVARLERELLVSVASAKAMVCNELVKRQEIIYKEELPGCTEHEAKIMTAFTNVFRELERENRDKLRAALAEAKP